MLLPISISAIDQPQTIVPSKIVDKMDVISAMEAVEDASGKYNARKKTPPSSAAEEKKRLIRELGRKPSEEKVSLYVRKPSIEKTSTQPTGSSQGRML